MGTMASPSDSAGLFNSRIRRVQRQRVLLLASEGIRSEGRQQKARNGDNTGSRIQIKDATVHIDSQREREELHKERLNREMKSHKEMRDSTAAAARRHRSMLMSGLVCVCVPEANK